MRKELDTPIQFEWDDAGVLHMNLNRQPTCPVCGSEIMLPTAVVTFTGWPDPQMAHARCATPKVLLEAVAHAAVRD